MIEELNRLFAGNRSFLAGVLPAETDNSRSLRIVFTDENPDGVFITEFPASSGIKSHAPDQTEYIKLVALAVESIKKNLFQKVVTSRIKSVDVSIDCAVIFDKMVKSYPGAFVYAFRTKDDDIWMGATPELLLQKRGQKFRTVSLAGTQQRIPDLQYDQYLWGEKEIVEQQIVTDFIVSELKNAGCESVFHSEPVTSAAGNVVHRKTYIEFESKLPLQTLVEILHPTPAVCGFPRPAATKFILEHEPHRRSYYAGVVGLLKPDGDADLFVNLRCMRVNKDSIELFVGGGITIDSIPENEWLETELKSRTLLKLIEE